MQNENTRSTARKITNKKMWKRKKPINKIMYIAFMQDGTSEEIVFKRHLKRCNKGIGAS